MCFDNETLVNIEIEILPVANVFNLLTIKNKK